jgi:hypothetical protein
MGFKTAKRRAAGEGRSYPDWSKLAAWLDRRFPGQQDPLRYWEDCEPKSANPEWLLVCNGHGKSVLMVAVRNALRVAGVVMVQCRPLDGRKKIT